MPSLALTETLTAIPRCLYPPRPAPQASQATVPRARSALRARAVLIVRSQARSPHHSGARRMEARSHQAAYGSLRITAGHQALAGEHGVRAPTGVGQQVGRTAHTGLGYPEHVVGQAGGD